MFRMNKKIVKKFYAISLKSATFNEIIFFLCYTSIKSFCILRESYIPFSRLPLYDDRKKVTMFGLVGVTEEKLEKLVVKGKWEKIKSSYLHSNQEIQVKLARACSKSKVDDCANILIALLEENNEELKIAVLKSMAIMGNSHMIALLQDMDQKLPAGSQKLHEEIQSTLTQIRKRG